MSTNASAPMNGSAYWVFEQLAKGSDRIAKETDRIEQYTEKEPARAMLLAFGAGVLLGLLVKRR